jgi:hypothetical protein
MAMLPQAANTEENSSTGGFDVLPEGEYICILKKSEWVDNKAKTGQFIYCEFSVVEGDHKGMVFIERLNLVNPNPVAVRIATQKMNQLTAACLLESVEDTDELHGIPVKLVIGINKNEGNDFPPQNEIKKFLNADGEAFVPPWE